MKIFLDEQDNDYKFSVIWISEKLRLLIRQVKIAWKQSPLALGYQTRLSLHAVTYAKKSIDNWETCCNNHPRHLQTNINQKSWGQ